MVGEVEVGVLSTLRSQECLGGRSLLIELKIVYFSRTKAPYDYKNKGVKYFRYLSVVSFLPKALKKYSQMKMGKIEKIEGIELLRALENNLNLGTFVIHGSSFAVDVKRDLLRVINLMPKDPIRKLY